MNNKLIIALGAILLLISMSAASTTVALVSPSNGHSVPASTKLLNLVWTATDGEAGTLGLGCGVYIKRPGMSNFVPIGKKGIANGGQAVLTVPLPRSGAYYWYVKCSNGRSIGTSATWGFAKQ